MPKDDSTPSDGDFREYLWTLRRRKGIVIASTLVVLAASLAYSYLQAPKYAATAKLLLRTPAAAFSQDSQSAPLQSQTEIEVINTEPVETLVRQKIGAAPGVAVGAIGTSDLIFIRAVSTKANRAAEVANAYATSYIEFRRTQLIDDLFATSQELEARVADLQKQIDDLSGQLNAAPVCVDLIKSPADCTQRTNIEQTVGQRRTALLNQQASFRDSLDKLQVDRALATGRAQLVTRASVPVAPFQPTPLRTGLLGLMMGLVIGCGLAFLVEYIDDSIKSKEDFEGAIPNLPVLGLIPAVTSWKSKEETRVVSMTDATSSAAESYRMLRTSVQFLGLDDKVRILQVTSASAREGKSTTLANLAVAFSRAGVRALIIDWDLRRPRIHKFFDLPNDIGFTSVLLGEAPLAKALQTVPSLGGNLLLLPSGPLPPNPSELLSSKRTADLLRHVSGEVDIVLVDSAPVLPVTDALVVSKLVDATILVVTAGLTTQKAAARAAELLAQVNAPVVGAVINAVSNESRYDPYSYGYYTGEPDSNGRSSPTNGHGRPRSKSGRRKRAIKQAL